MSVNKVILIGNAGDDPQIFKFDDGGMVAKISLATNESWKDKQSGEKVTHTEWHRIIVRNKGAEIIEKYVKKGDKLYIEGKLKTRKWTDTNNVERYTTEIECKEFKFLTPKNERSSGTSEVAQRVVKDQHAGDDFLNMPPEGDDDLPF